MRETDQGGAQPQPNASDVNPGNQLDHAEASGQGSPSTQTERIVALGLRLCELFHDSKQRPFARTGDGQILQVDTADFRRFLQREYRHDQVPAGLTVLLDSAVALRYLHRWQAGETAAMPGGYSLRPRRWAAQPTLVRLAEAVSQRPDLSFQHVKGHSGHALNEAADGLCHMARRRFDETFDVRPRAHALVDAFLRDWHASLTR